MIGQRPCRPDAFPHLTLHPARYTLHCAFNHSILQPREHRDMGRSARHSHHELKLYSPSPRAKNRMQDHPFATTPGLAPGLSHLLCSVLCLQLLSLFRSCPPPAFLTVAL